jgi:mannose-6-phosphate isomerase
MLGRTPLISSDNVLNVGFTPDKDSTKLVAKTMTATPKSPSSIKLASSAFTKGTKGNTTVYATPFEEFSIMRIAGEEQLQALNGPAIAIVTEGQVSITETGKDSASPAEAGTVFFIGAGADIEFSAGGEVWAAFYDGDENSQVGKQ